MSQGIDYLHSHSGIEREKKFEKYQVLVDEKYKDMFRSATPFRYNGKEYFIVSILEFVKNGGTFKNFME